MSVKNDEPAGLAVDEDLALHKAGWVIQKIGWIIALLFLILAAIGLFGTGPISRKIARAGNVEMEYEKFLRYESEAEIIFRINKVNDTATLKVPLQYFASIDVSAISPVPARNTVANGVVTYFFAARGDLEIYCKIMAKKAGRVSGTFTVNDHSIFISQLIYP